MEVSIIALFFAGAAAFVSPCVLPLIPVYIFYLAGKSAEDIDKPDARLILNGIMFIFGFSVVFMLLGATAAALGKYLISSKQLLKYISGAVIILFGILQTGLINFGFLNKEKRFQFKAGTGFVSSFILGAVFALGWTPCIGYTLTPALMLAATRETMWEGVGLLGIYSLGFAAPFIIISVFIKFALRWIDKIKKHMATIKIVSGIALILLGTAMILRLI